MTIIEEHHVDKQRSENTSLFCDRSRLRAELAQLEEQPDSVATRRRIRMLRRRVDDITSQIVTSNMGLVRSYTRRFGGAANAHSRADFESAGMLGLMRAVDSYDPERGTFGQWAFKPIQREVLRAVRDNDHPNLNLGDFEKRPQILRAARQLRGVDDSYSPSDAEIAAAADVTVAQVRRVLSPPRLTSLSQPADDDNESTLDDSIPSDELSPEHAVLSKFTLAALEQFGLRALDQRELYVVVRRFGLDGEPIEKLTEIGETLALSREAVRQIEAKALAKLQHPIVMSKLGRPGDPRSHAHSTV
ncbi:MAG: sigma-70 family RNA polymerase sigma factor [Ilumatobacter sp.]|jgi:RNA polymerase sigma factor (sigma-70 family)|uniref:sigma-70 family RNA polymerase sigma factor n=1 Tax=Ilumatobacter sp. TaxID=1967498 RepID=UPI003919E09C